MRTLRILGAIACIALVAGPASAQLGTPIAGGAYNLVPIGISVTPPLPVAATTPTGYLGIETTGEDAAGDRDFWVTNRGSGVAGDHWVIELTEDPGPAGAIGVAAYAQGAASGGVWGYRDLAYDGQFLYGGAEGGFIYEFDPVVGAPTGVTIPVGAAAGLGGLARALAYQYSNDTFIAANFNSIVYQLSRAGVVLNTEPATGNAHYGFAVTTSRVSVIDPITGLGTLTGEALWSYQQTGNTNVEFSMNATAGDLLTATGIAFPQILPVDPVTLIANTAGLAGGSCAYTDFGTGMHEIANMQQGTPNDFLIRYEHSPNTACATAASTVSLGAPFCSNVAGPLLTALNNPVKGNVFHVEMASSDPAGGPGVLTIDVPSGGIPAWGPLGSLIYVTLGAIQLPVALPAPPSTATASFYVPNAQALCGGFVALQLFQLTLPAPPGCGLPISGSEGIIGTVGT